MRWGEIFTSRRSLSGIVWHSWLHSEMLPCRPVQTHFLPQMSPSALPIPLSFQQPPRPKSYDEPLREKSVTIRHCAGAGAGGGRETTETERISHLSVSRARETEKRHPLVWGGRKEGREGKKKKRKEETEVCLHTFLHR